MTRTEFEVELEGICNTIKSYTNDHYVIGYLKNLKISIELDDNEKLIIILLKLINWYDEMMDMIQSSKFVYNKMQHKLTKNLLSDYYLTISRQ